MKRLDERPPCPALAVVGLLLLLLTSVAPSLRALLSSFF